MISKRTGDIFEQRDLNGVAHQTNYYGHFGGGIAKQIKELFPSAWEKSHKKCKNPETNSMEILGTFDICHVANENTDVDWYYIFNIYSQEGMGGDIRNTRYDVLNDTLERLRVRLERSTKTQDKPFKLGIPFGFGCGLAQGSWKIVEAIFESVFADSTIEVIIVTNPKYASTVKK